MLAAFYESNGPAREVLRVGEVWAPEPGPGEVRVRLEVAAVNPTDWKIRAGGRGPMPYQLKVPGQDGAGTVDAVGSGVDARRVGERVWLYHVGLQRPGGTAAQYAVVAEERAVPIPDGVDTDQAAALGIPFMTAHRCLFADGALEGASVLVAGGAGAVGNAAIQLARRAGATVIATASTEDKAELARSAGADAVVHYRREGAADEVLGAAPGGVDRVIELALGANLNLDLAVAAPGATIMTYATDGPEPSLPVLDLMASNIRLAFMLIYTTPEPALREAVDDITGALREGDLHPLPTVRYPLEETAAAHEASEQGVTGKVLIDIP